MIETIEEIREALQKLPNVPMQPLCIGSPFLQSTLSEVDDVIVMGEPDGSIVTVRSSEKLHKEDRHLKYIHVHNIFEVCVIAAYPTACLYPVSLRKACADELRRMMLAHQKLQGLIPRNKRREFLLYLEQPHPSKKADMDPLLMEWFAKILDRTVQYTPHEKGYRVPLV